MAYGFGDDINLQTPSVFFPVQPLFFLDIELYRSVQIHSCYQEWRSTYTVTLTFRAWFDFESLIFEFSTYVWVIIHQCNTPQECWVFPSPTAYRPCHSTVRSWRRLPEQCHWHWCHSQVRWHGNIQLCSDLWYWSKFQPRQNHTHFILIVSRELVQLTPVHSYADMQLSKPDF